ncbi:restriction endonuclease subunit S [Bifidobacterium longum]|uniref:restriction endonuclease subunit S n=1 Tax=Bifidobacterium longum TaxID=216816 RepID=UPI00398D059B
MGESKLRFKADDGSDFPDWEDKTLGELFHISAGGDIDKNNCAAKQSKDYPYPVYANALVNNGTYGYANYYKIDGDTFTVTGRGDVGHAVARHCMYVPIVRLLVCQPNMDDDVDFFAEQINYTRVFIESTGVPQLTAPQLSKIKVKRPTLPEQRKIADFLSAVDAVIAAQQAEVDAWEQRKKGVMQKLFSQEVRFKADDGSDFPKWEEKTLGEYCTQLKASIDPRKSPNTIFAEYSMPAFDESRKARFVSGREMNSARKILSEPCVLVNKLNVRKRRIWLVKNPEQNAVCSSEFVPLSSNAINLTFLSYFALTDRFTSYLMDCSSGSSNSQKRVVPDVILNYVMQIPSLPEQRKIADCLSSMDEVIQKSKDELAKWQELKKGLLQQMFV